jgi:hypothetical protein
MLLDAVLSETMAAPWASDPPAVALLWSQYSFLYKKELQLQILASVILETQSFLLISSFTLPFSAIQQCCLRYNIIKNIVGLPHIHNM